ncbi:MAG: PAS domain S-box protein [Coriobacteriia bacterium]
MLYEKAVPMVLERERSTLAPLTMLGIAVAYYAAQGLSANMRVGAPDPLWLPSGVGLALMLLHGRRIWPSLLFPAFVFALLPSPWGLGMSPLSGLAAASVALGEALLATTLIKRVGFDAGLDRLRDTWALLLYGMLLAPLAAGLVGSGILLAGGLIDMSAFAASIWSWFAGDALGVVCVTPLILTFSRFGFTRRPGEASHFEGLAVVTVFAAVAAFIFFVGKVPISGSFPYPVYPFVVWAALRMGQRGVSVMAAILGVIAVTASLLGLGPFAGDTFVEMGRVQTFVIIFAGTGFVLAAVVVERASAAAEGTWLSDVMERSLNEIYMFDAGTLSFIHANRGALENTGYSLERLQTMTPVDIKPEIDETTFRHMLAPLLDASVPQVHFQTMHLRHDGTTYPVEVWLRLVERAGRPIFLALINDITTRLEAENALRESDARYRLLADNMADVLWVLDPVSGRFKYVSPSVVRLRGYTAEETLGQRFDEGMAPEHAETISRSLPERIEGFLAGDPDAVTQRHEVLQHCKDGRGVWVEIVTTLVTTPAGAIEVLGVSRDIGARKDAEARLSEYRGHLECLVDERTEELQQTNEELAAVNEELEASNEELQVLYDESAHSREELARLNRALEMASGAKSDFLANMSHELRTPLNSIIGFTDILLQGLAGELAPEQRKQISMVNESGKHLLSLINDVLDLSKIEAGRVEPSVEPFDLCEEVTRLVDTLRPQAQNKGLALRVSVPETCVFESDCRMVRQIVLNLLSNAVKFTDTGTVSIAVRRLDRRIEVDVRDTGPGIAPDDRRRIFDSFTQASADGGRRPDGTGLGLAISNRLAKLLGGKISVVSTVGDGSTFTLVLPVRS